MNIGIDARPLVEKKVGFGYFLENMLIELLNLDKDNTYYLLSDREIVFNDSIYSNVIKVRYKDNLLCPKSFYYVFQLNSFLKKKEIRLDVFWATMHILPKGFSCRTKTVVTMYDFTHLKFPESTTKFNMIISKLFFSASIENSDAIVCISKNTKKELEEYYPKETKGKRICTVYAGGYRNDKITNLKDDLNKINTKIKTLSNDKYVLFVGTIEPRKNISLLLKAAPLLKGKVKIVVCGKIGWESEEIVKRLVTTDNLIYLDYVTQEEKQLLMERAFCQVQPSLYEGFGLPVVESMQSNTVVVVADNSSLSEIIQMQELKFETTSVESFCRTIKNLYENECLYKKAKRYCSERGREFSWEKAAQEYMTILEEQ